MSCRNNDTTNSRAIKQKGINSLKILWDKNRIHNGFFKGFIRAGSNINNCQFPARVLIFLFFSEFKIFRNPIIGNGFGSNITL